METVLIQAQIRNDQTKGSNNKSRKTGFVPGVLYGKEIESVSVIVSAKEMEKVIAKKGENAFAKMNLQKDGSSQEYNVILKEVQRHPYRGTLAHLDFCQVSMSEKLSTVVTVSLIGESIGAAEGGLVQQQLREINVLCLPGDIPASIEIDITDLKIGDNITVADVNISDKVEIVEEPSAVVVSVSASRVGGAEESEAPVEGAEETSATTEEEA